MKCVELKCIKCGNMAFLPWKDGIICIRGDCIGKLFPLTTDNDAVAESPACNDWVMCRCKNVQMGSYGNQLWVHPPSHMPKDNGYCLDRCIAEEVMQLWMKGITTTGCCCGHGKVASFIGVIDSDIPRMKEMGYKVAPNKSRPGDEDSFYAKGI